MRFLAHICHWSDFGIASLYVSWERVVRYLPISAICLLFKVAWFQRHCKVYGNLCTSVALHFGTVTLIIKRNLNIVPGIQSCK